VTPRNFDPELYKAPANRKFRLWRYLPERFSGWPAPAADIVRPRSGRLAKRSPGLIRNWAGRPQSHTPTGERQDLVFGSGSVWIV